MQTRFLCPACKGHHVLDMPETTIHLTCSKTGKHLRLDLGVGGEPVVRIVSADGAEEEATEEAEAGH